MGNPLGDILIRVINFINYLLSEMIHYYETHTHTHQTAYFWEHISTISGPYVLLKSRITMIYPFNPMKSPFSPCSLAKSHEITIFLGQQAANSPFELWRSSHRLPHSRPSTSMPLKSWDGLAPRSGVPSSKRCRKNPFYGKNVQEPLAHDDSYTGDIVIYSINI